MPNRLFGTDGVRGVANDDLSCELAYHLGMGAVGVLGPHIVVGRDTRRSGTMLESALTAGIMAAGGTPECCGIIPTPAVALLTVRHHADAGVVISASHNPPEYNGIKFFGPDGMKASDEAEDALADFVDGGWRDLRLGVGEGVGDIRKAKTAREEYVSHAISTIDCDLSGIRIALDCAHGASCRTTPEALERLGAEVHAINLDHDGMDINVGCGSTHLDKVRELVLATGADVGIAHDGDADRVLFVDAEGNDVDGDFVLAICAADLQDRGMLAGNEVVSTVMCNLGFVRAMQARGIDVVQTPVGDRFVLQRMLADGAVIGGEQSGHIIFLEHNTTGDGLVTALQLLGVMKRTGKPLAELAGVMRRFPQSLVNVRTPRKAEWSTNEAISAAVARETGLLGDSGRVLVRASGTEPLVRVMVEAAQEAQALECAERIADVVRSELDGQ
ncbi:MAG: phosphoglucosamine mutase [Coriobacteriales bacterium]|jgi:phosphoglucosamine mutase